MTLSEYLKNRTLMLLLNEVAVFFLCIYLYAVGNGTATLILIFTIWQFILFLYLSIHFYQRKQYFKNIEFLMNELDKPYLVQEFLENSWRLEDRLYKDILHRSNKAVIEQIYQLEGEQKEYREFIEGWIHEVKLPITGIQLTLHDLDTDKSRRVEGYLRELENDIEQALFFARSDQVYKDYMIKEMELKPVILKLLAKNKYLLIQNQISVDLLVDSVTVYSDPKWIAFILNQILLNAVKYKKNGSGKISFSTEEFPESVVLYIRDQGIGIPEEELHQIFEKGFTGSNGRSREKSTGIGLYLCRKLCQKLDLEITASSSEGEYTQIALIFPKNSFLSKL